MTVILELEVIKCRKWIKEVKNTRGKKSVTVSARNSKKVFVLGTKEILIMVCVDLSRLRRGKMHNKAEKLDMFNKYCCSLFVRRRNDPLSAHVRRSCQGQPEAEQGREFPAGPWGGVPWTLLPGLPLGLLSALPSSCKVWIKWEYLPPAEDLVGAAVARS